jgi:hypothetical protein
VDKYIFEEQQRSRRAEEVLVLITNLGPTAIKWDKRYQFALIPEEYANGPLCKIKCHRLKPSNYCVQFLR